MSLQPLTISTLRPFPLPKKLGTLPADVVSSLASLYELTKGFVMSLQTYKDHEEAVLRAIEKSVDSLNRIIELLDECAARTEQICALAKQLDLLYQEFLSLETYQYQLLSANYSTNTLKARFEKRTKEFDAKSIAVARSRRLDALASDLLLFLHTFKDARKEYHLRREKLNRWDEERVSRLI